VATAFFLVVMAASGYYVFTEALAGGEHVTTPSIVGLSTTDASFQLAEQGLELGKPTLVPHPSVPEYHVITQRPPAGRVVRTGRKVYPTVSSGARFQDAPDLRQQTLKGARQSIADARFRIGSVARIPDTAPRDTVIAQDPPPGKSIANQGDIHLLVSAGAQEQTGQFMPDIRGLAADTVAAALEPYGVTIVPQKIDIPGARTDIVLNQDPAPNALIYPGDVVTYVVKESGAVELTDTRRRAEVRHVMERPWHDVDVRVEVVDRRGNRQVAYTKPPLFDNASKSQYVAGSAIRLPVTYVGEATVEVYLDGRLTRTYRLDETDGMEEQVETQTPGAI